METVLGFLQQVLANLGLLFLVVACLTGLFLSCLSISGTWVVVVVTLLAFIVRGSAFPGLGTLLFFIYISVMVEVVEYLSGVWGVKQRGGSGWAGFAAIIGGIFGLMLGTLIPIPVLGSIIGMMLGSFGLVYAVEHIRLKEAGKAAHIAWGTVLARFAVVFVKVVATLGMSAWLLIGIMKG